MRKTLICVYDENYSNLHNLVQYSHQRYADKHGFEYIAIDKKLDINRPTAWSKLKAVRKLIEDYDFLVCIDVDAIFVDFDIDITNVVSRDVDFAWVVHRWQGTRIPNSGFFAVNSSESARLLLDRAYDLEEFKYDRWWDQKALMEVLGYPDPRDGKAPLTKVEFARDFKVQELDTSWNSVISDIPAKPKVLHFAGLSVQTKLVLISYLVLLQNSHSSNSDCMDADDLPLKYLIAADKEFNRSRNYFNLDGLKMFLQRVLVKLRLRNSIRYY